MYDTNNYYLCLTATLNYSLDQNEKEISTINFDHPTLNSRDIAPIECHILKM